MYDSATRGWFEHLTARDLELLERVAPRGGVDADGLRTDPDQLTRLLTHEATYDAIFGEPDDDPLLVTSPFLIFALIVHRGWAELGTTQRVDEWVGPRQRLPVLSGSELRGFLDSAARRLFLTELLASYTRVVSGSTWVKTNRGWRRRKFSELDPVRLASLVDAVPENERPGVYRRLGDLALFLTGVFPDHTELHGLGPHDEGRLLRLSGLRPEGGAAGMGWSGTVDMLERLGRHWYGLAARTAAPAPMTGTMAVVADVAEQFAAARRSLDYLTDHYMFAHRTRWFGRPAS